MAAQLVVEGEARGIGRVQLDRVVSGNSECLAISREGVVRDWVVEEVVYLRSGHGEWIGRSSLYCLYCWVYVECFVYGVEGGWYAAPQAVTKPPRWPPQLPLCDADAGYHFLCDSEDITLHTKLDLPTFDYLHRIIYNGFQGCSGDRRPSQSHLVLLKLARQAPEG